MSKEVLITGVLVEQQMGKAKVILETKIIPQEKTFQKRKVNGSLSHELNSALKANA
jgi:hypothetical protein